VFRQHMGDFHGFADDSPCTVCVEDLGSAVLQSKFTTSKYEGWIHGRFMMRNETGKWLIVADHFEFTKELSVPGPSNVDLRGLACKEDVKLEGRELTDKQVRESLVPEARDFRTAFNNKDPKGCAAAYADQTVMRADIPAVASLMKSTFGYADPVVLRDKVQIEQFWSRMINDVGLHSMQGYERVAGDFPMTICVINDNMALVRSLWRMNGVGGHIHCQRMARDAPGKPWLVMSDFFAIYDTYPSPQSAPQKRKREN